MKTSRALLRICLLSLLSALLCTAAAAHAEPQVEAVCGSETVAAGTPFCLTLIISWQGDAEEYLIGPPRPELPEGIEQVSSSFSSSAREGMQRLEYAFVLRALQAGEYAIKPVVIKYWARGEDQESTILSPEISFKAHQFAFLQRTQGRIIMGALVCLMAGLGAGLLFLQRNRAAKRRAAAPAEASSAATISQLVQTCRSCKIQGDYAGFYDAAIALGSLLPDQGTPSAEKLSCMLEQIRFGGRQPPAEEVERLLRQLEKGAEKALSAAADKNPAYQKYCK